MHNCKNKGGLTYMMSVIETAIITIIISFISGLLLEYYKNLAPRILCNLGQGIPLELNNKKICAYIFTIRNISNKTIHELNLNIQGSQNSLKLGDAKITKGLKFDSSIKNNILDVFIPFLSKDDEFSVTLYTENQYEGYNRPIVTIRSPENFKEIDSSKTSGILSVVFNAPKSINKVISKMTKSNDTVGYNKKSGLTTAMNKVPSVKKIANKENREILHGNNKFIKNKKVILATLLIVLVISIGGMGEVYFQEMSTDAQTSDTKTNDQNQLTNKTESSGGTANNSELKSSTSGTNKNTTTKKSKSETNKSTDTKAPIDEAAKNTDAKSSSDETTGNADTKVATDDSTKNTDTKTLTGGSTDTKAQTEGTTTNTDEKTSTDVTTKSTEKKAPIEGTNGNTDTNVSTGSTAKSTGN